MDLDHVDLFDPDTYVPGVPHERFAELRREAPVSLHESGSSRYWCVTRHEDLVAVNRDAAAFSSWERTALLDFDDPEQLEQQRMMMLNMDPPEHTKLRKIVNKGFTPRMIRGLADHLAEEAHRIVADAVEEGDVDFVDRVSAELPLIAIAEFLGVPREDRRVIFDLSNRLVGSADPEYQRAEDEAPEVAAMEMYAYAQALADDRRARPRDDIVSALLAAEVDGERLDELEFNLFFMLLAVAGNETTRNAISHGMLALLEHPDQQQVLRDDPSKIGGAVEEILRWGSPVMHFRRQTTRPVTIGGVDIGEDEAVVFWHISANRDEAVFDDPYAFRVEREPNLHTGHVAFGGGGPHFCLGANLARAEIEVVFTELLRQATWEQTGPAERLRSNFINGLKHLPVRLTPAA